MADINGKIIVIENDYDVNVGRYYPWIYGGILETDELIKTENEIFKNIYFILWEIKINQYVLTADESGIEHYEHMFNIIADPFTEDLEFRRQRILNRFAMRIPFTLRYLKSRLNDIFGIDNYEVSVDYNKRFLFIASDFIKSSRGDFINNLWFKEIIILLTKIIPANMLALMRWQYKTEAKIRVGARTGIGTRLAVYPFIARKIEAPAETSVYAGAVSEIRRRIEILK